jgi:hypothetical protein
MIQSWRAVEVRDTESGLVSWALVLERDVVLRVPA